jgi:hypothetical protein
MLPWDYLVSIWNSLQPFMPLGGTLRYQVNEPHFFYHAKAQRRKGRDAENLSVVQIHENCCNSGAQIYFFGACLGCSIRQS